MTTDFLFLFAHSIKCIVVYIQQYSANVLGNDIHFPNGIVEIGGYGCIEGFIFCPLSLESKSKVFACQCIDVCKFLLAGTAPGMQKHILNNAVSSLPVMNNLLLIVYHFSGDPIH